MTPSRVPRLNAYVLAADPWWIEESVLSYYDLVDRIVVSYDSDGLSWTGTSLPVEECLRRVKSIDRAGKCDFRPGKFAQPDRPPLDNDTAQRRVAHSQAADGADWVVQIDTDEVLLDAGEFLASVHEADSHGADGLEYPARFLYTRSPSGVFLEYARPGWRMLTNYPGPVAARSNAQPRHARQIDGSLYRVDIAPNNTDPRHPYNALVHRVISPDQAILHYSWVRSEDYMMRKVGWSGHAGTYSEPRQLKAWRRITRHPILSAACPQSGANREWFRLTTLPPDRTHWRGERD